jgi:hypothetical protein
MWHVLPPAWILNLFQDSKIWFDFKLNLTSAISNFSRLQHLASYVSRHDAMAYDNTFPSTIMHARVPVYSLLVSNIEALCDKSLCPRHLKNPCSLEERSDKDDSLSSNTPLKEAVPA